MLLLFQCFYSSNYSVRVSTATPPSYYDGLLHYECEEVLNAYTKPPSYKNGVIIKNNVSFFTL